MGSGPETIAGHSNSIATAGLLNHLRIMTHFLFSQVADFDWPHKHMPDLEKLVDLCRNLDSWLRADPQNVIVVHCHVRGQGGREGGRREGREEGNEKRM